MTRVNFLAAMRGVAANEASTMSAVASVRAVLSLLSNEQKSKYLFSFLLQILLSILDLLGVILIGAAGAVAAIEVTQSPNPEWLKSLSSYVGRDPSNSLLGLVVLLFGGAIAIFIVKAIASAVLLFGIYRFLGKCQASVANDLTALLMHQPVLSLASRKVQEYSYALSRGVATSVTSLLGALIVVSGDLAVLVVISAAFLTIDPIAALFMVSYLGIVGWLINRALKHWLDRAGAAIGDSTIVGQDLIRESLTSIRELRVMNRISFYQERLANIWSASGSAHSTEMFVMQVPKLAFETAMILGVAAMTAWTYASSGLVEATGTLALLLAGMTRIMPSMLRISSMALYIKSGAAQSRALFPIVEELRQPMRQGNSAIGSKDYLEATELELEPTVNLRDIEFRYLDSESPGLNGVSLDIKAGSKVAITGPSGAGKTTLVEVALGLVEPESGLALIGGLAPGTVIRSRPGFVAYVPQRPTLVSGTIRSNIAFAVPAGEVNDEWLKDLLRQVRLDVDRDGASLGLDTVIGEQGLRLSGGQQQRLGLARALYSNPKLIILDEATSSLDATTESSIMDVILGLGIETTVVVVAHRLASIRNADQVIYMESGRILAQGKFEEVRRLNVNFDHQVRLMGM